ncbi:carbohydrate ABC transporter permease [uncultured Sphaerochaeta sp.]|uniref:carbohydrate ABC transporter permease n=1 Tax=uncultured Sphaerochaeta sp. TaxID=886478 RepID=UPI002A0A8006|nr:carbohydrate ABC transporter permease [uncultured Sphaerochaeta sp.]
MKAARFSIRLHTSYFDIFNGIFLVSVSFLTLYPVWYILVVSVSSAQYINQGAVDFIPRGFNVDAYKIVFQNEKIWRSYMNTITYTTVGTLINVLMTTLCAYPLARKDLFGRKAWTFFFTLTMFVSGGMIPLYLVIMQLHLINTMWAIVLPPAISTYNMIVMRTSFEGIPISLTESAYLDGANDIQILSKIIIPLSKPILATMTLFYAVAHWNSFFPAMLYLNEQSKYPVQVLMRDIVIAGDMTSDSGDIASNVNILATNYKYAVIVISIIPILLVYPLLQRHFTKGVMVGAVKG